MTTQTLLTGLITIVLFLMAMAVIFWYIFEYGKTLLAREREYDRLYFSIQADIKLSGVTLQNYNCICAKIIMLKKLRWRNKEKTEVLESSFYNKFSIRAPLTLKKNQSQTTYDTI